MDDHLERSLSVHALCKTVHIQSKPFSQEVLWEIFFSWFEESKFEFTIVYSAHGNNQPEVSGYVSIFMQGRKRDNDEVTVNDVGCFHCQYVTGLPGDCREHVPFCAAKPT